MRAYGSGFQMGTSPVVMNLIIINVLVFLLKTVMQNVDLDEHLGLFALQSPNFKPWQVVTHLFMHADLGHIFGNMFGLFMFGSALERLWGAKRFLTYYLLTGLGAATMQLGVNAWEFHQHMEPLLSAGVSVDDIRGMAHLPLDEARVNAELGALMERTGADEGELVNSIRDLMIPMIGASGAVFGVLLAFGMMFPNEIIYLQLFIPIKAKYFVVLYGLLEFFYGMRGAAGDSVAHYAHLGGMIFGFFLVRHWKRTTFL